MRCTSVKKAFFARFPEKQDALATATEAGVRVKTHVRAGAIMKYPSYKDDPGLLRDLGVGTDDC